MFNRCISCKNIIWKIIPQVNCDYCFDRKIKESWEWTKQMIQRQAENRVKRIEMLEVARIDYDEVMDREPK